MFTNPIDKTRLWSSVETKTTLQLPWLPKRHGPGVYEVQGDARLLFKNISDTKWIARGLVIITLHDPSTQESIEPVLEPKEPATVLSDHPTVLEPKNDSETPEQGSDELVVETIESDPDLDPDPSTDLDPDLDLDQDPQM